MENLPYDFKEMIDWYSQTPERAKKFDEICARVKEEGEKIVNPHPTEIKCIKIISSNSNKDGQVL